ncbi:putative s-adenosyl-l-methionine-dependent methyltransferase [Erysiphe neolycopersici]|uniref:Putative s-adenosyl-l-methionine-dependent methyltransferase n=1 Tax=Erysiphe neolycopersici TaxID=212602 RepID=A0A420HLV4_9PEZI|nr:putative s-adenosyl-l-methionine-dependent methyltransferase [Erysiphe neolycopersici]
MNEIRSFAYENILSRYVKVPALFHASRSFISKITAGGFVSSRSLCVQPLHDDDLDSTLGDDTGSEADYCSVTDSVYDFPVENGRTYHAYMDGSKLLSGGSGRNF